MSKNSTTPQYHSTAYSNQGYPGRPIVRAQCVMSSGISSGTPTANPIYYLSPCSATKPSQAQPHPSSQIPPQINIQDARRGSVQSVVPAAQIHRLPSRNNIQNTAIISAPHPPPLVPLGCSKLYSFAPKYTGPSVSQDFIAWWTKDAIRIMQKQEISEREAIFVLSHCVHEAGAGRWIGGLLYGPESPTSVLATLERFEEWLFEMHGIPRCLDVFGPYGPRDPLIGVHKPPSPCIMNHEQNLASLHTPSTGRNRELIMPAKVSVIAGHQSGPAGHNASYSSSAVHTSSPIASGRASAANNKTTSVSGTSSTASPIASEDASTSKNKSILAGNSVLAGRPRTRGMVACERCCKRHQSCTFNGGMKYTVESGIPDALIACDRCIKGEAECVYRNTKISPIKLKRKRSHEEGGGSGLQAGRPVPGPETGVEQPH